MLQASWTEKEHSGTHRAGTPSAPNCPAVIGIAYSIVKEARLLSVLGRSLPVLVVANVLHPIDDLAIQLLLNREMRHPDRSCYGFVTIMSSG